MANTNLAPWVRLLINGSTDLPDGYYALILSVTVEASNDGADELVIRALAKDPNGKPGDSWRFLGENLLSPGNLVTVEVGYRDGDPAVVLQRFRLVAERAQYSKGAPVEVEIRGYSADAALGEYTRPRVFKGPIADSDIVKEIADFHGLTVTGDSVVATATRTTGRAKEKGTSDLVFLQQLAVANGYGPPSVRYDSTLDADVLTFAPQVVDTSAALTLVFDPAEAGIGSYGTLLDFQPEIDLHGVPTRVEVTGWDHAAQEPIVVVMELSAAGQDPVVLTGDATSRAGYKITSGSQMRAKALEGGSDTEGERVESVAIPSVTTVEEAVAWAGRWISLRNRAFMVARGTTFGIPELWTGQVHEIAGVAPTHAGYWEIVRVKHKIDQDGYTCDLDFDRVLDAAAEATEGSP